MKNRILYALILTGVFFLAKAHPLKMAYTAVKYNQEKQVFEISHRVFQDDFENTLSASYHYTGDVFLNQHKKEVQQAVNTFFNKNFQIQFNEKRALLHLIKIEQKHQMGIVISYETNKMNSDLLKTVAVYNNIMMESFKEQVNMFNFKIADKVNRTLKFELNRKTDNFSI